MRLVAVQRWPVVPNAPQSAPSRARSRLASSITIMRVFAAHFQRDRLEGGGGALAHVRTHGARPGKADGADFGMLDQGLARIRPDLLTRC